MCHRRPTPPAAALQKLRIKAEVIAVDAPLDDPADLAEHTREQLVSMGQLSFAKGAAPGDKPAHSVRVAVRSALLGDLLRKHSSGAALVAVTLPLPAPNVAPGQYMASLDVLSDGLPPTIMLRGNNDNVITFSS